MLSIAAAVVLAVRGVIHLIGSVVPWQLATVDGFPFRHHLANARSKVGAETTAQLVWILAPWLPEVESTVPLDD